LLWVWEKRPRPPLELIGSNLYLWFSVALLALTPMLTRADPAEAPVSAEYPRSVSIG